MRIIKESDPQAINITADYLRGGKIIAFATDTVYGIGADASNFDAVDKLYKIKKRSSQKPIAIFLKDLAMAKKIFYFDKLAEKIAEKFLPGSLTMVLRAKKNKFNLAKNLNLQNNDFLGFRIINRSFIVDLFNDFNGILAVSSANISGEESASCAQEVKKYFSQLELDLLIDGAKSGQELPSTVVKIDDEKLEILRQGPIKI